MEWLPELNTSNGFAEIDMLSSRHTTDIANAITEINGSLIPSGSHVVYSSVEPELGNVFTMYQTTVPNTTIGLDEIPALPPTLFIVLSTLALSMVVILTIVGNVLVLLAVAMERSLRSVTHYFIVNLAVADLLLGTTVLPFSATYEIIPYWPFGPAFCDVWAAVDVLCCTASINSLCVISIDRYIGVTRPLQHNMIMTKKRAAIVMALVWIFSVAISAGPLFGWRPPTKDPNICPLTDSLDYVLFSVAGSFYIPLIIILVLYYRIYREAIIQTRSLMAGEKSTGKGKNDITLRIHTAQPRTINNARKNRSKSQTTGLTQKLQRFNKEKKAAKTLGIVVGVFIVCWLPFFMLLPITSICGKSCFPPELVFKIAFWLGYCNSCLNPIIYALSNRSFKRAFKRILTCQYGRRKRRLMYRDHYLRTSGKNLIQYQNSINGTRGATNRRFRKTSTSGYELTEISVTPATPSPSSENSRSIEGLKEELRQHGHFENRFKQTNMNIVTITGDENCNSESQKLLMSAIREDDVKSRESQDDDHVVSNTDVIDEIFVEKEVNQTSPVGDPSLEYELCSACKTKFKKANEPSADGNGLQPKKDSSSKPIHLTPTRGHERPHLAIWERMSSLDSETTDTCNDSLSLNKSRESVFSLQIVEEGDIPLTISSREPRRSPVRRELPHIHGQTTHTDAGVQTTDSLLSLDFLNECLLRRNKNVTQSSLSTCKCEQSNCAFSSYQNRNVVEEKPHQSLVIDHNQTSMVAMSQKLSKLQ
uniref:5-hydroxytryptamine receptor 1-like n=1 Tax=Saccoglossus kowalevskii TaxID=10224 RepID=A0ABM0M629_SACKO|nr:PREDICTED: 5-hydroxytryptamine receptor 1-like [Saccoglossus kowalevskii]